MCHNYFDFLTQILDLLGPKTDADMAKPTKQKVTLLKPHFKDRITS